MPIPKDIHAYNTAQPDPATCNTLARLIDKHLPGAESRIWHRHPVWFLDGNPIVGYSTLKTDGGCTRLLFWSGRSFDEPGLSPEGGAKFKTAGARYSTAAEIVAKDLKRWLGKAAKIQ